MADFLALDWDNRNLSGFAAQVGKGSVRIVNAFALEWPAAPDKKTDAASNDARRGEWLAGELKRLKIGTQPVMVCLPRESAVVLNV